MIINFKHVPPGDGKIYENHCVAIVSHVELFSSRVQTFMTGFCRVRLFIYEPPRGKPNNVVSEQVRHKPTCTSTEKS